jgi:hypothetical protein
MSNGAQLDRPLSDVIKMLADLKQAGFEITPTRAR